MPTSDPIAIETIPSINDHHHVVSYSAALLGVENNRIPAHFPINMWQRMLSRYDDYWKWFDGTHLNETEAATSVEGETIYRFPLRINPVRNIARKRASTLLGEGDDTFTPLVKTLIDPKKPLDDTEPSEEQLKIAHTAERIVNEVWTTNGGRALQFENATLGEFLGGSVFKLSWKPWRKDLLIPITIEKVLPDHFMPIWNPKDFWDLYEVFEIFYIDPLTAEHEYGIESNSGSTPMTYVEHWTKENYSIYLNGEPITVTYNNGKKVTYKDIKNPWGRVPYVYIPTQRDGGSFFGSSLVEDIRGLVKEFNARMADYGDAIRTTVHRKRYSRNVQGETREIQLGAGTWAIDLGTEAPHVKNPPDVFTEDAPAFSEGLMNFSDDLWKQIMREGWVQNIAFGEDEGSQRSALTLAFRFWPTTAKARVSRTNWTDGLNLIAGMILQMVAKQQESNMLKNVLPVKLPESMARDFQFDQDWRPMIPRDREQEISEIILLFQSGLMSPERALQSLGGIQNIPDELKLIEDHLTFKAELAAAGQNNQDQGAGSGAKSTEQPPTVASGAQEGE